MRLNESDYTLIRYIYDNIGIFHIRGRGEDSATSYAFINTEKFENLPSGGSLCTIDKSNPYYDKNVFVKEGLLLFKVIVYRRIGSENKHLYVCKIAAKDKTLCSAYRICHASDLRIIVEKKKEKRKTIPIPETPEGFEWEICMRMVKKRKR
jgi:hypothetical protein